MDFVEQHLVDECRREQPFVIHIDRAAGLERGFSIDSSYIIQSPTIGTQTTTTQPSIVDATTSNLTSEQPTSSQASDSSSHQQQSPETSQTQQQAAASMSEPPSTPSSAYHPGASPSISTSATPTLALNQMGGAEQMDTSSGAIGDPTTPIPLTAPLAGVVCPPRRTQLIKVVLDFLKKCITDHVFADSVRHSVFKLF